MSAVPGQGDAGRVIRLLWRDEEAPSGAPGPKRGLSLGAIVAAAVAVADETGMAGLSMRAVGERLGRTSMALYTYVGDKAELVDLMYDHVHGELAGRARSGGDWRERVHAWAADLTAMYLRHPWVPEISFARAVLGPREQAVLEDLLGVLEPRGLAPETVRVITGSLFHLVRGFARTIADAGEPDTAEWERRTSALAEAAPDFAARFPLSVRLSRETGWDPDWRGRIEATMRAGIDLLLAGAG